MVIRQLQHTEGLTTSITFSNVCSSHIWALTLTPLPKSDIHNIGWKITSHLQSGSRERSRYSPFYWLWNSGAPDAMSFFFSLQLSLSRNIFTASGRALFPKWHSISSGGHSRLLTKKKIFFKNWKIGLDGIRLLETIVCPVFSLQFQCQAIGNWHEKWIFWRSWRNPRGHGQKRLWVRDGERNGTTSSHNLHWTFLLPCLISLSNLQCDCCYLSGYILHIYLLHSNKMPDVGVQILGKRCS